MPVDFYGKDFSKISEKKLFLFDMDGTLYLENDLFEGVVELLAEIQKRGARYVFITNNSSKSVEDYVKKVNRLGITTATKENFFTSTQTAIMLLKERHGESLIYAQGTQSFVAELKAGGLNVTEEYDESAQAILVGFDAELSFEKMLKTSKMLTKCDVPYYATNPDWVCPVEFGYVPDCGSMCFGYEKATGRAPEYLGKPKPTIVNAAMAKWGASKAQTVVIGDRLYTDIASGVNAGVDTICMLCGESTVKDVEESDVKPTFVCKDILTLLKAFV